MMITFTCDYSEKFYNWICKGLSKYAVDVLFLWQQSVQIRDLRDLICPINLLTILLSWVLAMFLKIIFAIFYPCHAFSFYFILYRRLSEFQSFFSYPFTNLSLAYLKTNHRKILFRYFIARLLKNIVNKFY
jgi:hypothetical protein